MIFLKHRRIWVLMAALSPATLSWAAPLQIHAANPQPVVIQGGTLIDGTGGPPRPDVAILLERGRVRQIARTGTFEIPPGAQVILADGKYILPGFIDAHVHYNQPFLHLLYLAQGVTTVRDLGSDTEAIVRLRDEIASGNILGPRMFVSGSPIREGSVRTSGRSAAELTQQLVDAGVDGIKVTGYTEQELREITRVAHENGLTVYGHTRLAPGAAEAIRAGLDGIEHVTGILEHSREKDPPFPKNFDWNRRDHFFRYFFGQLHRVVNSRKVDDLIRQMVQSQVYLAPTLVNHYRGFVLRGTGKLASDPALRYMPRYGDRPDRYGEYTQEDRENWKKTLRLMQETTLRFHQAGGLISLGTDSQAAAPDGALPGWSLHEELELFVEAGLTPEEALRTATLNNARVLQAEKDLGTVEVGKYADLVLLDANPLQDIRNSRRIYRVIREGTVLDPQELLARHLLRFGERR